MKKFIILLLLSIVYSVINAQTETISWDFPVKPGSEEWASFTTAQQKRDACQIPQKTLEALSTKDLVVICLNYPLLFDYAAFDDERIGASIVIKRFNGFEELSKRKDGIAELVSLYKNYPIFTQRPEQTSTDYSKPFKLPFIELLLSDDLFSKQLDNEMSVELGKIVLEKYAGKLENKHIYSIRNIKKTLLLGAVVMSIQNRDTLSSEQKEVLKRFIENYNYAVSNLLSAVSKIIVEL